MLNLIFKQINLKSNPRPEVFLSVTLFFFLHCITICLVSAANIKMYRYYNIARLQISKCTRITMWMWNILRQTQMRKNGPTRHSLWLYVCYEFMNWWKLTPWCIGWSPSWLGCSQRQRGWPGPAGARRLAGNAWCLKICKARWGFEDRVCDLLHQQILGSDVLVIVLFSPQLNIWVLTWDQKHFWAF